MYNVHSQPVAMRQYVHCNRDEYKSKQGQNINFALLAYFQMSVKSTMRPTGRYKFDNLQSMRCRQIVEMRAAHIPVQEISNTYFQVVGFNNAGDFDKLSPTSSVGIV